MADEGAPLHPNELRARRQAASLSRAQLAELARRVAETDPVLYASVSARSLERLERGEVRPHARIAHALAVALGLPVPELFPSGLSDHLRNPEGNTRVPDGRPPRGKARKTT